MSGKKGPGRKINALETKIHKAALAAGRPLTQKEVDVLAPEPASRINALNYLSSSGLLRPQQDASGLLWRAVTKQEFEIKQSLNDEENMVLNYIQASSTQGIWTKHIKSKTELHQTVVDRCLKSLTQKQLVKVVKSVKYPTRKIYMLANLEPSVELTGGPWYTDNELDLEFIQALTQSCLSFIRGRSFPKPRPDVPDTAQPLFAPNAARYPDAHTINVWIAKNNITPTELTDEHVEAILSVLVLDGEIERLPATSAAVFDLNSDESGSDSDSDEDHKSKKRKRSSSSRSKKRRRTHSDSEDEDASGSTDEEERRKRKKGKAKKRKRTQSDDDVSDDPESSPDERRKRRKKRRKEESESEENSDSDSDARRRRRKRSKSRKSRSEDEGDSDDDKKSRRSKRAESPAYDPFGAVGGGGSVYRAVRPERVALGWAEAPCGACPVFEFCTTATAGPVNPRDCEYYGGWLERAVAALDA
ncbi:hypothetical protein PENSPDRAFT_748285 [Peniophora sp. CONT]|nr:hypothetical protein PENSPDRAFT_748285 [Peniophora sp. CONT]